MTKNPNQGRGGGVSCLKLAHQQHLQSFLNSSHISGTRKTLYAIENYLLMRTFKKKKTMDLDNENFLKNNGFSKYDLWIILGHLPLSTFIFEN